MGGLSTYQALQIIRGLNGINLVGMGMVEVAPAYDVSAIAWMLLTITQASLIRSRWRSRPHGGAILRFACG